MAAIKKAISKDDFLKCFEVMHALRPHLTKENIVPMLEGFVQRGYHLLYIEENGIPVCASGYRFTEHLHWGKAIYIDDLSTLPEARGKGYASCLLEHIFTIARETNCDEVHLDSGCGANRYDAHRLYLKTGFHITSHHFAYKVTR
jgi:GNAT superfamily N-acetyltransferase